MSLWSAIGTVAGSFFGPVGTAIGGAIGGAIDGSNASSSASRQQQAATDAATAELRRQYDQTREDFAPYRQTGYKALSSLQSEIDQPVTSADVMADPGYLFGLQQGQTALDRKIAAMGGRVSGAALKAATRFGTDYASTGYGAAYQRKQDRLNRLAALAGIGQTSTGASAAAGTQMAGSIGNYISSQGNANAAATLGKSSIWGNTANQIAALYGRNSNSNSGYGVNGSQGYFTQWNPGGGFQSGTGGMGD